MKKSEKKIKVKNCFNISKKGYIIGLFLKFIFINGIQDTIFVWIFIFSQEWETLKWYQTLPTHFMTFFVRGWIEWPISSTILLSFSLFFFFFLVKAFSYWNQKMSLQIYEMTFFRKTKKALKKKKTRNALCPTYGLTIKVLLK